MSFPPLHPALVHLPIAFVLLSVASDLCARWTAKRNETRRAMFRAVGFGSLIAAFGGGMLTIATGYLDLNRAALARETVELADFHLKLGWILAGLLGFLTAWRWLIWHRGQMTINTSYLAAGILVLGLTFFQGWYGTEMVYSYGAGVAAAGQGTETPDAAQTRLATVKDVLFSSPAMGGADTPGGTNELRRKP